MKRSWIGCGVLVALLILGLAGGWAMGTLHEPVAACLQEAAQCAMAGQWEQAEALTLGAQRYWNEGEWLRNCLSDKSPVEDIESQLERAKIFLEAREDSEFASACAELAVRVLAMGDAHRTHWGNLL